MFEWTVPIVRDTGYFGIAFLMLAENVFPPIPSELIMPLAGFTAASGELDIVLAILAGSAGSLAGAVFWYYVGAWIGADRLRFWAARHGRWLTATPSDIDQACAWFSRYCGSAVLIGRMVPAVRTFISVPAGITGMSFGKFLALSYIGTLAWTSVLAGAGYLLEARYVAVSEWLNPVSNVVVGTIVLVYLYRVATFRRRVPRP